MQKEIHFFWLLCWIGFSPPSFHLSVQNAQMETFKFLVQFPQNDDATRTDTCYYYGRGEQYVFQKNTITDVLSLSLSFFSSSPPYSIHLLGIIQLNSIFNRSNKVFLWRGMARWTGTAADLVWNTFCGLILVWHGRVPTVLLSISAAVRQIHSHTIFFFGCFLWPPRHGDINARGEISASLVAAAAAAVWCSSVWQSLSCLVRKAEKLSPHVLCRVWQYFLPRADW